MTKRLSLHGLLALAVVCSTALAQIPPGESPRLGNTRINHADVLNGQFSLLQLRKQGRRIFSTPFNKFDGHGDGALDPNDPTSPGHRPTLQNNGTFLRVNGLDSQTCAECHGVTSNATIPATLGIPGVAGASANAMAGPTVIDVADGSGNGFAGFNGRFINPPFLFGAGGVELLGKEMTLELQQLKMQAFNNTGQVVPLVAKGVSFGSISHDGNDFDYSNVQGIENDLVVRPFGRKGEFTSTRQFDQGAAMFHLGMRPNEVDGPGTDVDGDGVSNELTVGEMSVLHFFGTLTDTPQIVPKPNALLGFFMFEAIGCSDCHKPALFTVQPGLTYSYPEVLDNPAQNVYATVDLRQPPMSMLPFGGGTAVLLFADLKRHDMGPGLAESTGTPADPFFTTARLWGVADTAPYMHDGRALTLTEAILAHGGEAQLARNNFANMGAPGRLAVLDFLRSLRTPVNPGADLGPPLNQ